MLSAWLLSGPVPYCTMSACTQSSAVCHPNCPSHAYYRITLNQVQLHTLQRRARLLQFKQDANHITCQCRSSHHVRWPSYSSPTYIPQQHHSQLRGSPLQAALAHAKAAAAAGQECIQELMQRVQGGQGGETQPVKRPGENVPAGMLKLTLHDVELTTPGLCFCVIKVGPHWGRTSTLTASPKAAWDWEVSSC